MNFFKGFNFLLRIVLHFFSDPQLPRKITVSMITMFRDYFKNFIFVELKSDVLKALDDPDPRRRIEECFDGYDKIFDYFHSDEEIFSVLKKKGYIEHELIPVGYTWKEKLIVDQVQLVPHEIFMAYVPLRDSLRRFLNLPGMFEKIMNYVDFLKNDVSGIIFNVMQGRLWKEKYEKYSSIILLPLFFYYDEFESGNALGSHAGVNKFGAMYSMLACLPPDIASKLTSILFTGLICARDKKDLDNSRVFDLIIKEFNYLRKHGIKIKYKGKFVAVRFQLVLILGDNLGLNEIFDMVESFRDTVFCRVCKAAPEQWKIMAKERKSILRNKENYAEDIISSDPKRTGIVKNSVFNSVNGFHIMDNVSFDMMHDYLHGVLNYVLRSIIFDFVFKKEIFTLDTLNQRIQSFDFPEHQRTNKPPEFQFNAVKNKVTLKCSAAEMLTLIRFFGIIAGDLVKNHDDESWLLYRYAAEILDILMTPFVEPTHVSLLENLVKNLNSLYLRLFGPLKPKFHYLVHYARYLLINGPLVNYWTMRYESKHRQLKSTAVSISCNINLLVSIAIKQTLAMCNLMHNMYCQLINVQDHEDYEKKKKFLDKIEINNSLYCKGVFLVVDNCSIEKKFGEIQEIYQENDIVTFVLKKYEQLVFDEHIHAYILSETQINITLVRKFDDLPKIPPCFSGKVGNNIYVIPYFKL